MFAEPFADGKQWKDVCENAFIIDPATCWGRPSANAEAPTTDRESEATGTGTDHPDCGRRSIVRQN
eukprot:1753788-Alexandrium_andersonii.AAC.1